MSNTKLKPCPFCGGLNLDPTCKEQEQTGACRQYFYVYCNLCQACGPTDFRQDDAIEQWNLRAFSTHHEALVRLLLVTNQTVGLGPRRQEDSD